MHVNLWRKDDAEQPSHDESATIGDVVEIGTEPKLYAFSIKLTASTIDVYMNRAELANFIERLQVLRGRR